MIYQILGITFGLCVMVHYFVFLVLVPAIVERWLEDPVDPDSCTIAEQKPLD